MSLSHYLVALILIFTAKTSLFGQVPVHEEPYHKPVLTVEGKIRIIDLKLPPGDTSAFHVHTQNMWFYTLKGTKMWLQTPVDSGRNVNLPTGFQMAYLDYSQKAFTHRIANLGEDTLKVIAIENLHKTGLEENTPSGKSNILHLSTDFKVEKYSISPGRKKCLKLKENQVIVLCDQGILDLKFRGKKTPQLIKAGDWDWTASATRAKLKNEGTREINVLSIEAK